MEIAFYLSGFVAVLATVLAITNTNPVHALLYLIASLLAVAMVFFSIGAPFAGALEVIVYAGAIMVLFVFVVMMLNLGQAAIDQERRWLTPKAWIGPGILCGVRGKWCEEVTPMLRIPGSQHSAGLHVRAGRDN